jgi:hypothetical protein
MRGFLVTLSALCCLMYVYMWYKGIQVPAWSALIWCGNVFLSDLENWFQHKLDKLK